MKTSILYASMLAIFTCNAAYAQEPQISNLLPGADLLGKTYDIFGSYAENNSVKRSIFDFSKAPLKKVTYLGKTYQMPDIFEYTNINESHTQIITGESSNDLSKQLAVSAGLSIDAKLFSTSVSGSVFENRNSQTYNYYSSFSYKVKTHQIGLEQSANQAEFIASLKPLLAPKFAKEINDPSITPEQIFKTYHTHFLADIILGAKIQQDIRIESYYELKNSAVSAAVEAEFKLGGMYVRTGNENGKTVSDKTFISISNAKGGNITLLGDGSTNSQHYSDWAKTVSTSPVLIDFNTNSFIPIWELANDNTRKQQLKKYFDTVICSKHKFNNSVLNKPGKPSFIAERGIPFGQIVDGRMKIKGAAKDHTSLTKLKVWLNASNMWEWGSEVFQEWTFGNNPNGIAQLRSQKPYPSGHTTETRKVDGKNNTMKIERYTIHENGDFYIHIFVQYVEGEKPNNNIVYDQWIKSDKPLNVRDINLKKKVYASFFDGALEFDFQF